MVKHLWRASDLACKNPISAVAESFPMAHCFLTKAQFQFSEVLWEWGDALNLIFFQCLFLQKSPFGNPNFLRFLPPPGEMPPPILFDFQDMGLLDSMPSTPITRSVIEGILCWYGISKDTVHKCFDQCWFWQPLLVVYFLTATQCLLYLNGYRHGLGLRSLVWSDNFCQDY